MISRGGSADVYGRDWRRTFAMTVPVSEPDFWNNADIRSRLSDVLHFASDDIWEFAFTQANPELSQLPLSSDDREWWAEPDTVVKFSGGADSLCAVVEALLQGRKPLLVSHRSTPPLDTRQQKLISLLRERFPEWQFPHVSVWIHRKGADAADTTQRTRAFLYAALGAMAANQLAISKVLLSDNGMVSLNLPINAQIVGALASRSTHPKFLHLFNSLLVRVFGTDIRVSNTLWNKTRPETLSVLAAAAAPELLQETVSYAHTRGRTSIQPHCGVCSQCVDRRFGVLAEGLEEHDITERYEKDIFISDIPEGETRSLVVSYVQFAIRTRNMDDNTLFAEYPQLMDCIVDDDPHLEDTARALGDLIRRHSQSVTHVMIEQTKRYAQNLVLQELPPTCLIQLAVNASMEHIDKYAATLKRLTQAFQRGMPPAFQDSPPKNERAVQNIAQSIVQALDEQLRREVPLLPFAGISTKPDFSTLPNGGKGWLFIEFKYPSSRARLNHIVTEITSRQIIYPSQGAYAFFVVYDPKRTIVDDEQFKLDTKRMDNCWLEVIR
jgi:7-cyano-7-deazaguanine synthase in queuosine biosynthesis